MSVSVLIEIAYSAILLTNDVHVLNVQVLNEEPEVGKHDYISVLLQ